jgi:dienelactone hydrolase
MTSMTRLVGLLGSIAPPCRCCPRVGIAAFAVLAVSAGNAEAQPASWPAARSTHGMVWHDRLGESLLLGGVAAAEDSALWGWNGERWRAHAAGGPAGRAHFGLAYDPDRDRVIVHGGVAAVFGEDAPPRYGDTWEWDGLAWHRVSTEGPGPRDHHAMVYDPVRRQTVLFGGNSPGEGNATMADTWAWDGLRWRRLADSGPPGRATHRMVFDSRRGRIVMFGGWGANGLLDDTWAWDGREWSRIAEAGPAPRFATRMAYDSGRDRIVLFGGRGSTGAGGGADFGDTWEFDGTRWNHLETAGPAIRNVHAMVYDAQRRQVLVFGGFNSPRRFDDLWAWEPAGWRQLARPDAGIPPDGLAPPGPYGVGYRLINHRDPTRRLGPARDFEGRPTGNEPGLPMQMSVWYPARDGSGAPIVLADYLTLDNLRITLAEPDAADIAGAAGAIRNQARLQLGLDLPAAQAESIAAAPMRARRDAPPAPGTFPLVAGVAAPPASVAGLAEYLASHGYVVATTPTLPHTASREATQPQIALETQTRDLEVLAATARELPFVDPERVALLGRNFAGMAALVFEMRNMSARAVVNIDGWEALRPEVFRASPFHAVDRMRVPYTLFASDDPNLPDLREDAPILDELRYADRHAYVIRDLDHGQILNDHTVFPQLTAERRLGYDFMHRTIRMFLDAHVKDDSAALRSLQQSAVERGYPAWLVNLEVMRPALHAVPTAEEIEEIAMSGDIARLAAIYRRAAEDNPGVELFSRRTAALFAFRFMQRGDTETALDLHRLAVEAHPSSALAHNDLGNAYRDAGRGALALEHWRLALELVDEDPEIASPATRAQSRFNIEAKIRQAGG